MSEGATGEKKRSRLRRGDSGSKEQDKMRGQNKDMRKGAVFVFYPVGKA